MRLSKKDKEILYNVTLMDRKEHLESLLEWVSNDPNPDGYDDYEGYLQEVKIELKMLYRMMKQIEKELGFENLYTCEYEYEGKI